MEKTKDEIVGEIIRTSSPKSRAAFRKAFLELATAGFNIMETQRAYGQALIKAILMDPDPNNVKQS